MNIRIAYISNSATRYAILRKTLPADAFDLTQIFSFPSHLCVKDFDVVLVEMFLHEKASEQISELLLFVQSLHARIPVFVIIYTEESDRNSAEQVGRKMVRNGAYDYYVTCSAVSFSTAFVEQIIDDIEEIRLNDSLSLRIRETEQASITAICDLTECRDANTGKHIVRVSVISRLLASKYKNKPEIDHAILTFEEIVGQAASLHDIGKVAIRDHILLKEGAFEPSELETMRSHTVLGAEYLRHVCEAIPNNPVFPVAMRIALSHHERFDGTGYPHGLAGENIPLEARIVSVADVYDALTHKRCYRMKAYPHSKVCKDFQQSAGSQFDPEIVEIFMDSEKEIKELMTRYKDNQNKKRKDP